MNTRRKLLFALGACLLALHVPAFAQASAKLPRIGLLSPVAYPGERDAIIATQRCQVSHFPFKCNEKRNMGDLTLLPVAVAIAARRKVLLKA